MLKPNLQVRQIFLDKITRDKITRLKQLCDLKWSEKYDNGRNPFEGYVGMDWTPVRLKRWREILELVNSLDAGKR